MLRLAGEGCKEKKMTKEREQNVFYDGSGRLESIKLHVVYRSGLPQVGSADLSFTLYQNKESSKWD